MKACKTLFLAIAVLFSYCVNAQFLHADGTKIVDGNGNNVLLRGMGLGGWMLQEGYMLETADFAGPQHEIRAAISDLIGETKTDVFYDAWHSNHCTKADIDSLKSWGFNSVRLPMHYNLYTLPIEEEPVQGEHTWLEKGFTMTDQLLDWCKQNEMYLILDLHAAPGGQGKDANISDYDTSKPSLWESDLNKAKTVALWRKLAERYADEEWIGGYDLINETNWNFTGSNQNGCDESSNTPLKQLFVAVTEAIRAVDRNHIIYIEGNCWANNHNGLLPFWDQNMVLSFHKYWSNNNLEDLNWITQKRDQYNIPIWMGEAGENSNTWFRNAIKLFEDNNVGWAWWPMKKIGSVVGPLTVERTEDYNSLLNYWKNGGAKPTEAFAYNALMEIADDLLIGNNTYHPDVIDAMFRQVSDNSTKPFKMNTIPGQINATDFDMGRNGYAYYDLDTGNYRVSTGVYTTWNTGWTYRNDGVDIEVTEDNDVKSNGYNVGWTNPGEWMQYTATVTSSGGYSMNLRYATNSSTKIHFAIDGKNMSSAIVLPSTGGWQSWSNHKIEDIVLYEGETKIKIYIEEGTVNLGYMDFFLTNDLTDISLITLSGETNIEGNSINLNFNKRISNLSQWDVSDFKLTINNSEVEIINVELSSNDASVLSFNINTEPYDDGAKVLLSYSGDQIIDDDQYQLGTFTDFEIQNNRPFHNKIPAKIEAENFDKNNGLGIEETTDIGGGFNIGYTDTGDYADYRISVIDDSNFSISARIAAAYNTGKIGFYLRDENKNETELTTIITPVTSGWQKWQTVESENFVMAAGLYTLRMKVLSSGFNMNWFTIIDNQINGVSKSEEPNYSYVYPNPATGIITLARSKYDTYSILTITGFEINAGPVSDNNQLSVENLKSGIYILQLTNSKTGGFTRHRFLKQ